MIKGLVTLVLFAVVVFGIVFVVDAVEAQSKFVADYNAKAAQEEKICLDHGYTKRIIIRTGDAYCYKLDHNTDVTVPVTQVQ